MLSAINCSAQEGNAPSDGEQINVTLSRLANVNSPNAAPRIKPGLLASATAAPQAALMRRARARTAPISTPIKAAGTKPNMVNAE